MRFNNNGVPSFSPPPPRPPLIISERRRVARRPYRKNDTARYDIQKKSFPREGRERHNLFHENLITFIRGRAGIHTLGNNFAARGPHARSPLAAEYFRVLLL